MDWPPGTSTSYITDREKSEKLALGFFLEPRVLGAGGKEKRKGKWRELTRFARPVLVVVIAVSFPTGHADPVVGGQNLAGHAPSVAEGQYDSVVLPM